METKLKLWVLRGGTKITIEGAPYELGGPTVVLGETDIDGRHLIYPLN